MITLAFTGIVLNQQLTALLGAFLVLFVGFLVHCTRGNPENPIPVKFMLVLGLLTVFLIGAILLVISFYDGKMWIGRYR